MLNLNSTIVSFCFSGALKLKLDTCMTCASSEKYPRAWRALAPLYFFFRDAVCFASLAWRARAIRLEGQVHLSQGLPNHSHLVFFAKRYASCFLVCFSDVTVE